MKISVVIPAFNEAATVAAAIDAVKAELPEAEVVVVDDGSKDRTSKAAAGADRLIRHLKNQGKAAAIVTGCRAASGEIIAMVDADMAWQAGEVTKLVDAVKSGQGDMAVAVFSVSQGGGLGLVRGLATWGIRFLTGRTLQAPLSGQRAAKREVLTHCLPNWGGFGLETELSIRALRRGYTVVEVPTVFVHQGHGWTPKGFRHRGRQFIHIFFALLRGGLGRG